jgi:hypothetical protein
MPPVPVSVVFLHQIIAAVPTMRTRLRNMNLGFHSTFCSISRLSPRPSAMKSTEKAPNFSGALVSRRATGLIRKFVAVR